MSQFSALNPRNFFAALVAIDEEARAERISDAGAERRATVALLTVAVCLLIIHYLKFETSFQVVLVWMGQQPGAASIIAALGDSPFSSLYPQLWWGTVHLTGYVLIPMLVIRLVLGERVSEYGLRWNETSHYIGWYVLLAAPIICFAFLASFRTDFARLYPFYPLASRSWFDLLAWEAIYLLQFACLEFFFRGFFLHACKPVFGLNAVFVMVVPYLMIHFSKPWLEATGAILFGVFLGVLALRSRSIWGGVQVHMSIALSMDILALLQTGRLPVLGWPG